MNFHTLFIHIRQLLTGSTTMDRSGLCTAEQLFNLRERWCANETFRMTQGTEGFMMSLFSVGSEFGRTCSPTVRFEVEEPSHDQKMSGESTRLSKSCTESRDWSKICIEERS